MCGGKTLNGAIAMGQDLLAGRASLDDFAGLVAVGGFSYADVLDSAKGWAGAIRRNARLWRQFLAFRGRPDTFSLGVCNGAQLFALLGWVPGGAPGELADVAQPRFVHNASGRFESRWVTVRVEDSPSVLLKVPPQLLCHHSARCCQHAVPMRIPCCCTACSQHEMCSTLTGLCWNGRALQV